MRPSYWVLIAAISAVLTGSVGLAWLSENRVPAAIETDRSSDQKVRVNSLGLLLTLPSAWRVVSTTQPALLTMHDGNGKLTHIYFEPDGYFYHNPLAETLSDYARSYRGHNIDVVIDATTWVEVDGEPALFQIYRAGNLIDGELDSQSLASITLASSRYVLRHPLSGKFIIVSGGRKTDLLHRILSGVHFIDMPSRPPEGGWLWIQS